jgi:hypothetical protein
VNRDRHVQPRPRAAAHDDLLVIEDLGAVTDQLPVIVNTAIVR